MSAIHRTPRYQKWAPIITAYAKATPDAVCWRDGWTMAEHIERFPGRRLTWHAGHTVKGSETWAPWVHVLFRPTEGDWLAPEVSVCNIGAGNREREPSSGWLNH